MRKLIAGGVAVLSAATFTLGFASTVPAHAATPTIVEQVCAALPGPLASLAGQIVTSNTNLTNATNDLTSKRAALDTSVAALVAAIIVQITNMSAGLPTTVSQAVLNDAVSDYSSKIVAWSNALTVRDSAFRANQILGIQNNVLTPLQAGLCV